MQLAALWDLDGVLADSGPFHLLSWQNIMQRYGMPFNADDFRLTFGMNNTSIIRRFFGPETPQAFIDRVGDEKEELFRQLIVGRLQSLPGVHDLLAGLRQAGFRQAIGSSAPQANIDAEIDAIGVRPYFDAIISGANFPGKPDPTVYIKTAEALGVPPERCVVFEDAIAGVEAARRAGMRCIAVTSTNPAHLLDRATRVVERLDEVTPQQVVALLNSSGAGK